ncbi:FAD/NAD(P)-binding protein [Nakamurella aerolata]|uniref:FAD/NAD(P)-binding protein n=1 Tax=Nakamurella aerolata TaxID=1656892 RepID=A0A849A872_9ACTN|nr:FAD/NAD(P)-binding protein [Nakamurella aerolata]NNG36695.1 FAD/NAD(P)-binding protein [Nakamurella aerolata]
MTDLRVAMVGGGPRGTALVQQLTGRLRGNQEDLVRVHVVEPGEPGAGQVWATSQPTELLMNSPSGPTDLLVSEGSAAVPDFAGWLAGRTFDGDEFCPGFTPRRTVGRYLREVFDRLSRANPAVRVVVHNSTAVRLRDADNVGDRQLLELADGTELHVDAVVLAQGHASAGISPTEQRWAAAAERHGWNYQPSGMTTADRAAALPAGRPIALRGFGLAAIDLLTLLTKGRGGRFAVDSGRSLRYLPSGDEPTIWIGSRRGLPHRAKPPPGRPVSARQTPWFLTQEAFDPAKYACYDFRSDVWPLVRAEVSAAYRHHVRAMGSWSRRLALPHATFRRADGWWEGYLPDSAPAVDVRRAVLRDLAQCQLPDYPARLAARSAFVRATEAVIALHHGGWLSRRSVERDVAGWFEPMSSALTSGPPRGRLQQLVALADAGVVRFLGGAMAARSSTSGLRVWGMASSGPTAVDALVEARLASPDLAHTRDRLICELLSSGSAIGVTDGLSNPGDAHRPITAIAVDHRQRLLSRGGRAHPRRWAVGPLVRRLPPSAMAGAASRPELSVPAPRQVDTVVVDQLVGLLERGLSRTPGAADAFASTAIRSAS